MVPRKMLHYFSALSPSAQFSWNLLGVLIEGWMYLQQSSIVAADGIRSVPGTDG